MADIHFAGYHNIANNPSADPITYTHYFEFHSDGGFYRVAIESNYVMATIAEVKKAIEHIEDRLTKTDTP